MPPVASGICPLCESRGPVGRPCDQRPCQRRGYAFIPPEYLPSEHAAPGSPGTIDPEIGRTIGDHLLVGVVGGGGFGKVYLALQQPILMRTALKLMRAEVGEQVAGALERFEAEAQAMAHLSHPNVVRLLRYGIHQGAPYLVMELVEGGRTLKAELARHAAASRELELGFVRDILEQLLNGLEAAHALGVVHRDLKPENLMLQSVPGHPNLLKILDFGLAKFTHDGTETSLALGTPSYMAPEQILRRHLGPWTDLYAVGAIAFELVTGQRAFAAENPQAIVVKKLDPAWDPVRASGIALPPRLTAALSKALAADPERRYRSAPELRAALRDGLAELADDPRVARASVDVSGLVSPSELARALAEQQPALRTPSRPRQAAAPLGTPLFVPGAPGALETPIADSARPRPPAELAATVPSGEPTILPPELLAPSPPEPPPPTRPRRAWLVAAALAGAGGVTAVVLATRPPTPTTPTTRAPLETPDAHDPGLAPVVTVAPTADTFVAAQADAAPIDSAATDTAPAKVRIPTLAETLRASNPFVRIAPAPYRMTLGIDPDDKRIAPLADRTAFVPARGIVAPLRAYAIQAHEVTWDEYDRFVAEHPERAVVDPPDWVPSTPEARRQLPVAGVAWADAMAYCEFVGSPYAGRLPSEEEWEWAARSGRYANDTASDLASRRLWPWGNSGPQDGDAELGVDHVVAVMTHPGDRTPEGLWDLLGNVREWTADLWREPLPGRSEEFVTADGREFRAIRGLELGAPPSPEGLAARSRLCTKGDCLARVRAKKALDRIGFRCARDVGD